MSTYVKTELLGSEIEGVEDLNDFTIQLNYDRDKAQVKQETNIGTVRLSNEINQAFLAYLKGGITGATPGALEGPSFVVKVERGSAVEKVFDGYIDMIENHTLSPITSEVTVKEKNSIDFLNDVVDGFSFEFLHATGHILPTDFIWMPYVLNSVPDYMHEAVAILATFTIEQQLESSVSHIKEIGAEMANPFEAAAILKMVLFIAYLIALFIALVKLVKDIIQLVIQPVKYHACMSLRKQLEIGAAYLGYSFSSPILDTDPDLADLAIMPQKQYVQKNVTDPRLFGFTSPSSIDQSGYFKGTYGDLLRVAKKLTNGKFVISDSTIYLIRRDQGVGTPEYQLASEAESDYYQPEYKFNTDEFWSNYLIAFQTDPSEKNTIQEYLGTEYQVIIKPLTVEDQKLVLMKNLVEQRIPLALAKRKEELTVPEKIIKAFLDVFDGLMNALISAVNVVIDVYNAIVKVINKIIKALKVVGIKVNWEIPTIPPIEPVNLSGLIENRIGMLKIEYDQFDVPKIFIIKQGSSPKYNKLAADNATKLTAKVLWEKFYKVESFVPSAEFPYGNQSMIKTYPSIPFTFTNYQQVKRNNMIFEHDGNPAELESLKWKAKVNDAEVEVRFPYVWNRNLTLQFIEPDGR